MKNPKSLLLVVCQIITMAYIFVTGPIFPADPVFLILFLLGAALGVWAVYSFRTTKFHILPEVPENAALVTAGPYKIIRHPMYTSTLFITLALVVNHPTPTRIFTYLLLVAALLLKTEFEERYLERHFKEYEAYREDTQKLLPYIY